MKQSTDSRAEHPHTSANSNTDDSNQRIELLEAELRRVKTQLDNERRRHSTLWASLGEGLIVINQDGIITDINPKGERILQLSHDDLVGQWFPRIVQAINEQGELIDTLQRPITRALSYGAPVVDTMRYILPDGSVIPVAVTVAPLMSDNKPVGAIEVFRDVTQEFALDRAKDEFVSLASHQLRTPATAVKAILSMLLNGDLGSLTPRQEHFVGKAIFTNDRQLTIIEDMLNAAKVDAGELSIVPVEMDIGQLAYDAVQEHIVDLVKRKLTITVDRPSTPVPITADPVKLRMALDNLLSNAAKYTPEGGKVTARVVALPTVVQIAVADTGVGIDLADQDRLFRKFSRIKNVLSADVGGSGLGLYLAKHIVDLHGGSIEVDSVPGSGSTFTIELPLEAPGRATTAILNKG